MSTARLLRFAALLAMLSSCGCESSNKGKIEATSWSSQAATVKGQAISPGFLQLRFGGNGEMIYVVGGTDGVPQQTFKGKYTLGLGDMVIMNFNEELAGRKTHTETIKVDGNRLTMIDSDGTTIAFLKK